jgi:uncharacterized protein with FMN-binding domain
LVALGSAAVIAVYAAGYTRTRAVAQRLAEEEHRRPAIPAPPEAGPQHAMPEPPQAVTVAPIPVRRHRVAADGSHENAPDGLHEHARAEHAHPAMQPADSPVMAVSADVLPPATTADPKSVEPKQADPKAVEPPQPPAPPKPALKDGTYYGWGTSRHGDIQAAIVIKDGRITSASIAQCLTRYSCSWIAPLVPQVVQRQSAEVDYVSGATQSSNALYYAVLEALSKAK